MQEFNTKQKLKLPQWARGNKKDEKNINNEN